MDKHKPQNERRTFNCEVCGKKYNTLGALNYHLRDHKETTVHPVCEVCEKTVKCLSTHLKIHAEEKLEVCKHCQKRFRYKMTLRSHLLTHLEVKRYKCNVCSGTFTQSGSLITHMRLHTGDRPYKCDRCFRSFVSETARNKHKCKSQKQIKGISNRKIVSIKPAIPSSPIILALLKTNEYK